jgi:myotubularin-related protein 1/2
LTATFGHEPRYKKTLLFASPDERELFCNLVHAMIVSGPRAVALWKSLNSSTAASSASSDAPAASPVAAAAAAESKHDDADEVAAAAAAAASSSSSSVVTPDASERFCNFLISFSSKQTAYAPSVSPKAAAAGAGVRPASGGAGAPASGAEAPASGASGAAYEEHSVAMGGRARANANDRHAQILAVLSGGGGGGSGAAAAHGGDSVAEKGVALAKLVSHLDGRLLPGETPVTAHKIAYRMECECAGMGHTLLFRRMGGGHGVGGGSGPVVSPLQSGAESNGDFTGAANHVNHYGASQADVDASTGHATSVQSSSNSSNSSVPTVSASSRGLFLLTKYRVLYINYNDAAPSWAKQEAEENWENYAPWKQQQQQQHNSVPAAASKPRNGSSGDDNKEADNDADGEPLARLVSSALIGADSGTASLRAPDGGLGGSGAGYVNAAAGLLSGSRAGGSAAGAGCSCDVDVPLGLIARAYRSSARGADASELRVQLKDGRKIDFGFDSPAHWVEGLVQQLGLHAWPAQRDGGQTKLFAFEYKFAPQAGLAPFGVPSLNGWDLYDALSDYSRLTLASDPAYRLVGSNLDYKLCASYPRVLVTPAPMRDEELKQIAKYRSQSRLPAVVWVHPLTRASLSRCAQPIVSILRKRNELDEKLVALLRTSNPSNARVLHMFDARPFKAAMGNALMGKGFETTAHYAHTTLQFCGIDNIHAIRGSLERLREHSTSYADGTPTSGSSTYFASSAAPGALAGATSTFLSSASPAAMEHDEKFLSKLEASAWMHYVRLVLAASQKIAVAMSEEGASCITHCSDGWDRTSQLSALAQLMLDPFYRTLCGFAVLVEKEWLSFGHRFAERYGHASAEADDTQRAPIFLQFLDCVFQLLHQFPSAFEFTDDFLLAIHDHATSHRFGTFLFNNENERHAADLRSRTVSLWTFLLHPQVVGKFVNEHYVHPPHVTRLTPAAVEANRARMEVWERQARRAEAMGEAAAAGVSLPARRAVAPTVAEGSGPGSGGGGGGAWGAAVPVSAPAQTAPHSSFALQVASFFIIPSVSSRRLVLWEKMHLRFDREFMRTQTQVQAQIHARIHQAQGTRIAAGLGAAGAPSSVAPSSAAAPASDGLASAASSSDSESAWAARYALLRLKVMEAGIDIDKLEQSISIAPRPESKQGNGAAAPAVAPASPLGSPVGSAKQPASPPVLFRAASPVVATRSSGCPSPRSPVASAPVIPSQVVVSPRGGPQTDANDDGLAAPATAPLAAAAAAPAAEQGLGESVAAGSAAVDGSPPREQSSSSSQEPALQVVRTHVSPETA